MDFFKKNKVDYHPAETKRIIFHYTSPEGSQHQMECEKPSSYSMDQQMEDNRKWTKGIIEFLNPKTKENIIYANLEDELAKDGDPIIGVDASFRPHALKFDLQECVKRGSPAGWIYFKEPKNAERYIEDNKPQFSKKQIWESAYRNDFQQNSDLLVIHKSKLGL